MNSSFFYQPKSKTYKYIYSSTGLSDLLNFVILDEDPDPELVRIIKQQEFFFSGKEGKNINLGLIEEINRKSLLVEMNVITSSQESSELKRSEIIEKLNNILDEKTTEKLLEKNFFTQDIVKLSYMILKAIMTKQGILVKECQQKTHNLFRENNEVYISVEQSHFPIKRPDKHGHFYSDSDDEKPEVIISRPIELIFRLTDKGFQLLFLRTNDDGFDKLLESMTNQNKKTNPASCLIL
jgi:hypothetical protein